MPLTDTGLRIRGPFYRSRPTFIVREVAACSGGGIPKHCLLIASAEAIVVLEANPDPGRLVTLWGEAKTS